MSFTIRSNVSSMTAQRNLESTQMELSSSLSKLSSGMRITKAGDDAAGLGISVNLESQIKSYSQASRNANDGISVVQTAEGALNESTNILTRMRELAMEASSDGVGATQRGYINTEATELTSELDRIANSTEYNGTKLLNGTGTTLDFQVGIRNVAANDRISVTTVDATSATLFGGAAPDLSTKAGAQGALATIDSALDAVSTARATLGAVGNRLNSAVATIATASENLSAADSRIRDVNVAEETSNMSRLQVLVQAGVSVLAQANQVPQAALKLLQ
ncbi:MAG: flagellin FliC [Deltaproteobacteria bacterium]|nr:flagellin FliC [Deltaproteobacteria bacterium]